MVFQPSAKIIADSINQSGDRITTFVLTYHRMIHSEFMTHRVFSRNASSSRAIPVEKNIKYVRNLSLYPLHWGANQKGMQAYQEVDIATQEQAMHIWDNARNAMLEAAEKLTAIGIHKQVANRLLEPFNTITVLCTATDYANFFEQRCHPDAQPEIRALADAMKAAYDASEPDELDDGDWHLPFITQEEIIQIICDDFGDSDPFAEDLANVKKVSVGRCARVSYLNHDGKRDIMADIALHDRLLESKPPHLSPFEHCAMAMPDNQYANFKGWQSYRNMLEQQQ